MRSKRPVCVHDGRTWVTSSVTFWLVFVLKHTQARQVTSMQRKLDVVLRASTHADDALIAVEEDSDDELQALAQLNVEDRRAAGSDPSDASDPPLESVC